MSTKIKTTVMDALNRSVKQYDDTFKRLIKQYNDSLLAAAREINDGVSQRVIRANADLAAVDHDNENAFAVCVDELNEAEAAFIARHENTVVSL